jgi:hypothetical protein
MMCNAGVSGLARSRITQVVDVVRRLRSSPSWSCQVNKLAASVTDAARPDV